MKPTFIGRALAGAALLALSSVGLAQSSDVDYGKAEYVNNCSGCHGPAGKGDGHFKEFLTVPPTDLTTLTKKNGGVFPAEHIYQVIDGRKAVRGHGTGEMPIWGRDYQAQARTMSRYGTVSEEAYVRNSINLLVEYIFRLQEK
jgi:mono/diheme cytochrome c family protein